MRAWPPTRRQFLAGAGGSALGLAAGCGRPPAASGEFSGQTLTVFVYAGLDAIFQKHFVEPFEAATGATVVLDAGWWDAIAKLKESQAAGRPVYDLVLTDATQGYPAIKGGLFRQIDFDRVPNLRGLAPAVLDNWVARERYGVTFHESAQSLIWDKRQVKRELMSWGDLLRDELRGKLSLYDSFYMSLYAFACMQAAAEGRSGTAARSIADNVDGVLAFAKRERDRVRFWWPTGTKMIQDLAAGNFAAGNAHSVSILQNLAEKPDAIGFATPAADRAYVQLMWAIPANTPAAALAEAAIDYLLRRDVQAAIARKGMGTSHVEAAKEVAAADPNWAMTYPHTDAEFRALKYFPYDTYFKNWDHIAKVWEREVLRAG
jgi:putative spermidine/putrescine transport system substrate-binding protein